MSEATVFVFLINTTRFFDEEDYNYTKDYKFSMDSFLNSLKDCKVAISKRRTRLLFLKK